MSSYVKLTDPELGDIYFEVDDSASKMRDGGMIQAGADDDGMPHKFEEVLEKIQKISNRIIQNIRSIEMSPDEIECKFGVKFLAETGVIIAKASTEANIEITLTWKNEPKPKEEAPKA